MSAKLTRREKEKIRVQTSLIPDRGPTWVGFRSVEMISPRDYTKAKRKQGKNQCKAALNSYNNKGEY